MIIIRMKFPNFMIEKVLFVLERFGPTDIFDQEMSERCRNQITIFRSQFNFWLRSIIDCEYGRLIAG